MTIRVITKLPNSEQSYKGKVKTHKYINRQNQDHFIMTSSYVYDHFIMTLSYVYDHFIIPPATKL
jgi:hypothetical protein